MRLLFLALLGWAAYRIVEENRSPRPLLLASPSQSAKRIKHRGRERL